MAKREPVEEEAGAGRGPWPPELWLGPCDFGRVSFSSGPPYHTPTGASLNWMIAKNLSFHIAGIYRFLGAHCEDFNGFIQ